MRYESDNMSSVRRSNRASALFCVHDEQGISRKRLAEKLGLTPAAITKIVSELISEGLIIEGDFKPGNGAGRREIGLKINVRNRCALGVFFGLGSAILSAAWLNGELIFSEKMELPLKAEPEPAIGKVCSRLAELTLRHGISGDTVIGIGIALRGVISRDRRNAVSSYDTFCESDVPVCDIFERNTGLKTVLSNNVRSMLAAQLFLSYDPSIDSRFFLRCDSGIGGALSVGRTIWQGDHMQCSEIGHMPAMPSGGKPCHCGKTGCLETISSPAYMLEEAERILGPENTPLLWKTAEEKRPGKIDIFDVLNAARSGDEGARSVTDRGILYLSEALKSLVYLMDPGIVILYGKIFDHPYYMSRLLAGIESGIDSARSVAVVKSSYNGKLEELSAPLLAVTQYFENGGTD
ncbi:MAG: ROK family transcriptional regulator [Clostridia bacterium]|nr:ROK family transcriptional regulator [Clostridia bacterium]